MPATTAGSPEWKKLGDSLVERRVQLGFRSRAAFCEERGVDYRLVYDIEQARRTNFTRSTVAALEVAYALAPGSISRFLAGGDLETVPPSRPAAAALSGSGSLTVGTVPADLEVLAREAEILFPGDRVKQGIWMFPGDPSKQAIWRTEEPLATKGEIFALLDRKRGTVPPPAQGESAAG
jgi:hypothetical protein